MNSWNVANASMRRWQFRDQTLPLLGPSDAGLDDIFTAVPLLASHCPLAANIRAWQARIWAASGQPLASTPLPD